MRTRGHPEVRAGETRELPGEGAPTPSIGLRGLKETAGLDETGGAQITPQGAQAEPALHPAVLALGGALGLGEGAANTMKLVADDVQSVVIPGSGHWIAEEAPDEVVSALTTFLAPYHAGAATVGEALTTG